VAPGRIAGRFLTPYLLAGAGVTATAEATAAAEVVPVRVDVAEALAAHAAA
jgi:hypothetical protein